MEIQNLRDRVTTFCRNQIKDKPFPVWWRDPILVTAKADDRFLSLPKIASPEHMLPRELLPSCRTVIVFFIPFTRELANGNCSGKFPSIDWAKSLAPTNGLIQDISEFLQDYFQGFGYASELTPATYNYDCATLTARWSHKHLAHVSGLGRFGINAQMITQKGCAGRLGSLVTEAPMGNHPLITEDELCLHKKGKVCLDCMTHCPVSAVTLEGIDRHRCNERLQVNGKRFASRTDMQNDAEVCAKCISGMPCSLSAP